MCMSVVAVSCCWHVLVCVCVQLNYARYYLPRLFPNIEGRVIYIDDDCIVQGEFNWFNHSTSWKTNKKKQTKKQKANTPWPPPPPSPLPPNKDTKKKKKQRCLLYFQGIERSFFHCSVEDHKEMFFLGQWMSQQLAVCISGIDPLRQFHILRHWDRSWCLTQLQCTDTPLTGHQVPDRVAIRQTKDMLWLNPSYSVLTPLWPATRCLAG